MTGLINGELHDRDGDPSMASRSVSFDRGRTVAWRGADLPQSLEAATLLDELAVINDKEPLQFLLSMLAGEPTVDLPYWRGNGAGFPFGPAVHAGRMRNVLLLTAARSGWRSPLPARQGRGIAAQHCLLTYVAAVARVAVASDGRVRVPRIDVAVDCGVVTDAERVAETFRRAAVTALGDTVRGRTGEGRYSDVADIRIHIVRSDAPRGGIAEAGGPAVMAAIVNAVFAATGRRPRSLPVDPALLKFH